MTVSCFYFQKCEGPVCGDGYVLDEENCDCVAVRSYLSKCPVGYTEGTTYAPTGGEKCICVRKIPIPCPEDSELKIIKGVCKCIKQEDPICPMYTEFKGKGLCLGYKKPECPEGYTQLGCYCIETTDRVCEKGELTEKGCKCEIEIRDTPTCKSSNVYAKRCQLNEEECTCKLKYYYYNYYGYKG